METKKGFTLLELIVAMAIIAVLMGLSLFGIQSVQRSQRDTERRAALSNINFEIAAWYGDYGGYPDTVQVRGTTVTISGAGATNRTLTLKGTAVGITGTASTQNGTVYCYTKSNSTYQLGVNLESSGWGSAGTAQQLGNGGACNASNIISAN